LEKRTAPKDDNTGWAPKGFEEVKGKIKPEPDKKELLTQEEKDDIAAEVKMELEEKAAKNKRWAAKAQVAVKEETKPVNAFAAFNDTSSSEEESSDDDDEEDAFAKFEIEEEEKAIEKMEGEEEPEGGGGSGTGSEAGSEAGDDDGDIGLTQEEKDAIAREVQMELDAEDAQELAARDQDDSSEQEEWEKASMDST
jgi:hypothetical protein